MPKLEPTPTHPPRIVILGSINMDLVIRCHHLPRAGETIIAHSSQEVPGGKGANQAVAAARLGAQVSMIGRVGDDAFANRLLSNLKREGVDTTSVLETTATASGLAIVNVEESGENSITVVPGANHCLLPADVEAARSLFEQCDLVLAQLEVPIATVIAAVRLARQLGKRFILNPAPTPVAFPDELFNVDLICPNQSEAGVLLGISIDSVETAQAVIGQLIQRGAKHAVITLGALGAVIHDGQNVAWIPPVPITPVDTTAAGDAFAAAMAVRWCEGATLHDAATFAAAAGAFAATRPGAQPAMPTHADVVQQLDSLPVS